MRKRLKILIVIALAMLIVLGLAYANRATLLVKTLGFLQRALAPINPNQTVDWQSGTWSGSAPRPPNIIIILTDDMGFNDVSYHGGGLIATPHIDALAASGVRFTNGYAGSAVCAPSRAMLLTGRYATRFGFEFTPAPNAMRPILQALRDDDPMPRRFRFRDTPEDMPELVGHDLPFQSRGLPPEEITLAEDLKLAGYHTVHIGKWHLGRNESLLPNAQGFDESLLMVGGLYLPTDSPDVVNARNEFAVLDTVQWEIMTYAASFNNGARFEPNGYLTDYYTAEAVKVIEANKQRPFFLYLSHWGIHTPLQATTSDYEAVGDNFPNHRTRVYASMIRSVDRSVGAVMQALRDNGLEDNTLVIFTSDNGGANYIGLPDINKPYRGWKLSFFEGGTHVPFIMTWPGRLPANQTYSYPVSHLDIMPTALAASRRQPQSEQIDGVNLLPYLLGEQSGRPHDTLIWRQGHYQAIMSGGWKLQRSHEPVMYRLFHLDDDPFEQTNLADTRRDKLVELEQLLDAHNDAQAEPMWPWGVEIPIWIDQSLADGPSLQDDYIWWPN